MGTSSLGIATPQQQWQPASVGRTRVCAGASAPVAPFTGSYPRPLHSDALDHPRPRTSPAVPMIVTA